MEHVDLGDHPSDSGTGPQKHISVPGDFSSQCVYTVLKYVYRVSACL